MKQGKANKSSIVIIAVIVLIILGAGVFVYFKWFRIKNESVDLPAIMMEIDYALENGFYSDAENTLEILKTFSGNSAAWLRILKRAEALSRGMNDYSTLTTYAEYSVKDLPGNEVLHAIYTYGLLKEGLYEKAFKHGEKNLESETYHSLIAEAALNSDPSTYDREELSDNNYFSLLGNSPAGDPVMFEDLAKQFQDDRLFAATAIAWMMKGNIEKAVENIVQTNPDTYALLKYYIYYDYGEYRTALSILKDLQYDPNFNYLEGLLLQADVYMAMGDLTNAEASYRKIINEDPEISWIPYLNMAWIQTRNEMFEDAADYLIDGYTIFPQKNEVETALSIFLLQITRINIGSDILNRLEAGLQGHEDMLRVYKQAVQASKSPERYKAMLWELFNLHPENMKIAQYFSWYLIGIKDMTDLHLVLEKSTERYGTMEWINFFYGCINAVQGRMETSEQLFIQAFEQVDRWETAYNIALLAMQYGDTDKALEYFRMAESKLSMQKDPSKKVVAQIRVKMAWILYVNEQYEAAKRQISYALEIDNENLEGQLLKKKLEAETKR